MLLVRDDLLVEVVDVHQFLAMGRPKLLGKTAQELVAVVLDVFWGIRADYVYISYVRLRLSVTFEPVLITTLFLTGLAVPAQTLKSLGLHLIAQVLT